MSRIWPTGLLALFAAGAVAVSGCSSGSPGDLTAAGERVLAPEVQHVREVASTHNYPELQAAVAQLKALVRRQQRLGDVSSSRAVAIENAADILLEDASPAPSPTPSPTTTSPTPSPTPTTTSPTPTPTPTPTTPPTTASPIVSATAGGDGNGGIIPTGGAASPG